MFTKNISSIEKTCENSPRYFLEVLFCLKKKNGDSDLSSLSTVRFTNRIAVIDEGHVKEFGTHHELLAAGNTYARLLELQASGYR